jgi:O-methyltransferase
LKKTLPNRHAQHANSAQNQANRMLRMAAQKVLHSLRDFQDDVLVFGPHCRISRKPLSRGTERPLGFGSTPRVLRGIIIDSIRVAQVVVERARLVTRARAWPIFQMLKEDIQGVACDLYLDLLKQCLTRALFPEAARPAAMNPRLRQLPLAEALFLFLRRLLNVFHLELSWAYDPALRAKGTDWPLEGVTMIGLQRLQNLQDCALDVIRRGIPGDFIETGVWRGGACIFMRAILKCGGDHDRLVWVADSFQGLPPPDGRYAEDEGDNHWRYSDVLAVSADQVRANFARYGMLDDRVRFLEGWFKDTLPSAPIKQLAILRLDGDMYSSTLDALENLYPKLSSGGYAIIDDYHSVPSCRRAVDEFRRCNKISERIREIDGSGIFWRKS